MKVIFLNLSLYYRYANQFEKDENEIMLDRFSRMRQVSDIIWIKEVFAYLEQFQ